jgi:hypothetical protein
LIRNTYYPIENTKASGALAKLFSSMEKIMGIRIVAAVVVASAIAAPGVACTVNLYVAS